MAAVVLLALGGWGPLRAAERLDRIVKPDRDAKEAGKRPKVDEKHLAQYQARQDEEVREIVSLHKEIQGYYDEVARFRAQVDDPKEGRAARREIKGLESKIERQMKKLTKAVEDHLKPVEKVYEDNRRKYDTNKAKAAKLDESGQGDKAVTYHQEADKYTGKMEGARREMELTRWHLFFERKDGGEDDDGAEEGDERPGKDRRDEDRKKSREKRD